MNVQLTPDDTLPSDEDSSHADAPTNGPLPKGKKGPTPRHVREKIVELAGQGLDVAEIARLTGRSEATVAKFLNRPAPVAPAVGRAPASRPAEKPLSEEPTGTDLDRVIQFLAQLPEEAVQDIVSLTKLEREANRLREQIASKLTDLDAG